MFPFSQSRGGGAAAGVATTWSATNKDPSWSVSADQLTATHDSSSTFSEIRATATKTSSAAFSTIRQSGSGAADYVGVTLASNALRDFSASALIGWSDGKLFLNGGGGVAGNGGAIPNLSTVLVELGSDGRTVTFSVDGTVRGTVTLDATGTYIPRLLANAADVFLGNFNPAGKPAWG